MAYVANFPGHDHDGPPAYYENFGPGHQTSFGLPQKVITPHYMGRKIFLTSMERFTVTGNCTES